MLRLFFALQPTPEQNAALAAQAAPLVAQLGAQGSPVENLHVTLCFIGVIEAERLEVLRAAVTTLRGRPVSLIFDTLEYWETPKILCATSSRDSSSASELSIALGEAAVAAGFTPDIKPFRAHVTLARKISAAVAADCAVAAGIDAADRGARRQVCVDVEPPRGGALDIQCRRFLATV